MTPGRWRVLAYALVLAVLAVVLSQIGGVVDDVLSNDFDAKLAAAKQAQHVAHHVRDSVGVEARAARKENVVKRRVYTDARALLLPAFVHIDSMTANVHINTETFTIPTPVAVYIVSLQKALDKADSAFVAADSALAKTQAEVAAADTVSATAEKVIEVLQEKPGFLSRVWNRVKIPAVFVLGVVAARAVR